MANTYYIDKIKYGDIYKLLDSGALHDNSTHRLIGTNGSFKADIIQADTGIFNTLIATTLNASVITAEMLTATNARVTHTLTANQISTNNWEAANIANIGGNFYISPTGEQSGNISVVLTRTIAPEDTNNSNHVGTYTIEFGGSNGSGFGVHSTSESIWSIGSSVIATGEISYNNSKKYPLGSCKGIIATQIGVASDTEEKIIDSLTLSNVQSEALDVFLHDLGYSGTATPTLNCIGYKTKVSLYQINNNNTAYPIGILLTSYGYDKQQYIDIYNGENPFGTNTGFAEPAVRIGQLDGLPSIYEDIPTEGWGIYTTNGFFQGKIVSNQGRIGNFTISENLYSGDLGDSENPSVWISGGTEEGAAIGGSEFIDNWAFTAGNKFGVTANGELYANQAMIQGNIVATGFKAQSNVTIDETTQLIDVATFDGDGIKFYSDFTNEPTAQYSPTRTVIGKEQGFHIELSTDDQNGRLSFFDGNNEVAYINGQKLYINQSVVVEQMDVGLPTNIEEEHYGQWSWKVHRNQNGQNNLHLKWIG